MDQTEVSLGKLFLFLVKLLFNLCCLEKNWKVILVLRLKRKFHQDPVAIKGVLPYIYINIYIYIYISD